MEYTIKRISGRISKEKIIKDIIRVDTLLNKEILTKADYLKYSKVSTNTINKYFGSWHDALVACGLSNKSNFRIPSSKQKSQESKFLSNDDILKELISTAKRLGKQTITMKELNENSILISGSTVSNRFGGWKNGLKLAGLNVANLGKRYSDEECFNNLCNVWNHYGRQPTSEEMRKKPSLVGPKAYTARWGSWIKALECFTKIVNSSSGSSKKIEVIDIPKNNKKRTVRSEDKRDIPIGLRYKVLTRDNYKCLICGDNPSTNPKCKLHIDHIKPFSKGGKTKIDNLRTLCDKCNLGKSDKS